MVIGSMAHNVNELYFTWTQIEKAIESAVTWFNNVPDADIKWGKTGNREDVIKKFHNAVKAYFEEMPDYGTVLYVEKTLQYEIEDTINGITMKSPLPFYTIPDIVFEKEGLHVEDFKFKDKFSLDDEDGEIDAAYWGQAFFLYYSVKADLRKAPIDITFREIKYTKNSDWSSQHRTIVINCKSEEFELQKAFFWYQLMGFFKFIEDADADSYFPYNVYDQMEGRETMKLLKTTVFGYKQEKAEKSDLVKIEKSEIKEVKFIDSNVPNTLEEKIKYKFQEFGIALSFSHKQEWSAFDRYCFIPSRGVKMTDVRKYSDDVCQATEMGNIRILSPIPWTKFVGVEVPREERKVVTVEKKHKFPLWKDIDGKLYRLDFSNPNTPHIIIAGRSWSGKSVCLKNLVKNADKNTAFAIIDPKRVEFGSLAKDRKMNIAMYWNTIEEAISMLITAKEMMLDRYTEMEKKGITDISEDSSKPRFIIMIEEMAFLMQSKTKMEDPVDKERYESESEKYKVEYDKWERFKNWALTPKEEKELLKSWTPTVYKPTPPRDIRFIEVRELVQNILVEISAMGRAAGIHLILATQRPSVDVIPGIIKANIPARLCFATSSSVDTKVVLDSDFGAEKLAWLGDGLYIDGSWKEPIRIQTPKI